VSSAKSGISSPIPEERSPLISFIEVDNAVEALLAEGATSYCSTIETDCAFWPHLEVAAQTCRERLTAPSSVQLASINAMLSSLAARLDYVGRQVLVFELGLARKCDGFASDLDLRVFSQPSSIGAAFIRELLAEYPALRELLSVLSADAIRNTIAIECALLSDFEQICEVVVEDRWKGGIELADITEIEWESSETHERGKVVASFGTADCPKMFAYKPRCVAPEDLLTRRWRLWSQRNPRMSGWDLPNYLTRDNYGWVSWMPHTECESQSDVEDYFYRAGWLMGLATTFGVTDLNRDNIVACGASPIPVDLEAASHHRKCRFAPSRGGRLLPRQLEWNAMSTGLLPMWIWKGEDLSGVELSGFGGVDDQWCSVPVPQFVGRNTRFEKLVKTGVRLLAGHNIVKRKGRIQPPWKFVDLLLEGYQGCLEQLAGDRGWVASVLREIRDSRVRFLARPTAGYHYAMQASFHPVYLRDPAKRRRFLAECLQDGSANAVMFVDAEVEACYYGDVPRFAGTPAELLVSETSQCDEISVPDDEYVPGYQSTIGDVDHLLSRESRLFAERLVRGSFHALESAQAIPDMDRSAAPEVFVSGVELDQAAGRARDATCDYLGRFLDSARSADGAFFGFRASPAGHNEFGELGHDLYSGLSGIIYAISQARRVGRLDDAGNVSLYREIVDDFIAQLDAGREKLGGAYCGLLSGVLPYLSALEYLDLEDLSKPLLVAARRRIERTDSRTLVSFWGTDFLGGVAGALSVAIALFRKTCDDLFADFADRLAVTLRANAVEKGDLAWWRQRGTSVAENGSLTGLSHGQTGYIFALAEYQSLRSRAEWATALLVKALRHELNLFSSETMNWPDFRIRAACPHDGEFAWSHGAPGILLAYNRVARLLELPVLNAFLRNHPAESFARRALSRPGPVNHSLCHGALGNYIIFQELGASPTFLREFASWNRLFHWAEFDVKPSRYSELDVPGCMVGRAGGFLAWQSLLDLKFERIPFMPYVFE